MSEDYADAVYSVGNRVRLVTSPADIGIIIDGPRRLGGKYSYKVSLAKGIQWCAEHYLEPASEDNDPRNLFLDGSWGDRRSCLLFLTYLRISGNLSNYYYSIYNSRTQFFVHQFKPLIKFLDSPHGRVLLADEVGLGKTIEAGIILLEMLARDELNRALIVCPAKLRHKWRREMLRRFGLDFTIHNTSTLRRDLREMKEAPGQPLKAIVSYETLRQNTLRDALEDTAPDLDIAIADEAHLLRNRETAQFQVAQVLARLTNRLLLLTATPINNRTGDLFSLLHLLDPGVFETAEFYEQLAAMNTRAVELERIIRNDGSGFQERALAVMGSVASHPLGNLFAENYFYKKLQEHLQSSDFSKRKALIEAQRLALKVNLLSSYLARTRRVDVDEKRPQRHAHLMKITPAPEETALYKAVYEFLQKRYNSFPLPVMNMERVLASSMPAFVKVYGHGEHTDATVEDYEEDSSDEDTGSLRDDPAFRQLVTACGAAILEKEIDTKLTGLMDILKKLDEEEPGRKIIIFSYFRPTIAYLDEKLREAGYTCVVIHGGVPEYPDDPERDERERRRRQFADPTGGIRVMLSSEVGSEGLDFQFSHILINYDLPWNPMRVEQRIGRIDRIGQQADHLLIYSLVLNDTIDAMIYDKLLSKIDVFERYIGDIESILGTEMSDLREAMFNPNLTSAERLERAERIAQVLERRLAEAEELERDSIKAIGTDQYIRDEIQRVLSSKRYVGPEEVQRFVHFVFGLPQIGMDVIEVRHNVFRAELGEKALRFFHTHTDTSTKEGLRFLAVMNRNEMQWTFDAEIAEQDARLELFNLRHPAVMAVTRYVGQESTVLKPSFAVGLPSTLRHSKLHAGTYIMAAYTGEYQVRTRRAGGVRQRNEMLTLAWHVDDGELVEESTSAALMSDILEQGADLAELPIIEDRGALREILDALDDAASGTFEKRREEIAGEETALLDQRRKQVTSQAERDIKSQKERRANRLREAETAKYFGDDRQAQRLNALAKAAEASIRKTEINMRSRLDELPEEVQASLTWALRSLGYVLIR